MRYQLQFTVDGVTVGSAVNRSGIVTPPGTVLVARNEDIIVIKVPGETSWTGRCSPRRYYPAEYHVLRVEPGHTLGDKAVWVNEVLSFPVTQRKG